MPRMDNIGAIVALARHRGRVYITKSDEAFYVYITRPNVSRSFHVHVLLSRSDDIEDAVPVWPVLDPDALNVWDGFPPPIQWNP